MTILDSEVFSLENDSAIRLVTGIELQEMITVTE